MRASMETDLIDAGENIHDVAGVLGHSPQVALEHDIRMRPGNLRGMIERSSRRRKPAQNPAQSPQGREHPPSNKKPEDAPKEAISVGACPGASAPKRMGEDSNPRRTFALSGFQDRRLRPLGHPSGLSKHISLFCPNFAVLHTQAA